jgi:hypothetical protein
MKFKLNDQIDLALEFGERLLFTDYLDDVSTTYADPKVLLNARGAKAVELADRSVEQPAAIEGMQRGNPKSKDWYFIGGLKLQVKLGDIISE